MPLYRIVDRGHASRRAWIQLLRSLTPMTVAECVEVLDGEGAFAVDPAAVIELDIERFAVEHGVEFEQESLLELPDYPGPSLAELEGWAARGFELDITVRYLGGPRKIAAIKACRARDPSIGLRLAKDLVERGQPLAQGLDVEQARAWSEAMAEYEGRVRFELRPSAEAYAIDPGDRGCEGVERAQVLGPELVIERGPLSGLAWARVEGSFHPDPPTLARALDAWCAQARARGLQVFSSPLELLAASTERNPELEASLRAASEPSAALTVHCDWLQSRGDSRAELALAQLSGDDARARELIDAQASALFGPLALVLDGRYLRAWAGGFVEALRLELDMQLGAQQGLHPLDRSALGFARALLELPCCACLRRLELVDGSRFGLELSGLFSMTALSGLRRLELGSTYGGSTISSWAGLERLEELRVTNMCAGFEPPSLPNLRVLEIAPSPQTPRPSALVRAELPRLECLVWELHEDLSMGELGQVLGELPRRPIPHLRVRLFALDQAEDLFAQLRAHAEWMQLERVEVEYEDEPGPLLAIGRQQLGEIVHIVEHGAPLV